MLPSLITHFGADTESGPAPDVPPPVLIGESDGISIVLK